MVGKHGHQLCDGEHQSSSPNVFDRWVRGPVSIAIGFAIHIASFRLLTTMPNPPRGVGQIVLLMIVFSPVPLTANAFLYWGLEAILGSKAWISRKLAWARLGLWAWIAVVIALIVGALVYSLMP